MTTQCRHWHVCGDPEKGVVIGICKFCGDVKEHRAKSESFREDGHPEEYGIMRDVLGRERAQSLPWQ